MFGIIVVGQTYGGENISKMKEVVGVTLTFTMILSIAVALIGGLFTEDILKWMGAPENILVASAEYALILFVTLSITFIYMCYTTFMRVVGDSKTPFYFLLISIFLNIALLSILIFDWLSLLEFGLNDSAYTSVLSNFITFWANPIAASKRAFMTNFANTKIIPQLPRSQ